MSAKTFNYYCDESSHLENDHRNYMVIGYISVPYNKIKDYKEKMQKIRNNHFMFYEMKWSHISKAVLPFYLDLTDFFFSSDLSFRAIIIEKKKIKNASFGQDFDTFYYKMYYQLLAHKLDMGCNYNIFLDFKDSLAKYKIAKLKEILNFNYGVIRNIQSIRSDENPFIQLCDLFIGSLSYFRNDSVHKVEAKMEIIKRVQQLSGINYCYSTYPSESKFNLFYINL